MKIPSVPPRKLPQIVRTLDDLRFYGIASTVSSPHKFILSSTGDKSIFRFSCYVGSERILNVLVSRVKALELINSYVWHAFKGANKED